MSGREGSDELRALRSLVESLQARLLSVEEEARDARQEAQNAREEILRLRDVIAAAQRDQQDLRTTRARLARLQVRGLLARVLNRPDRR